MSLSSHIEELKKKHQTLSDSVDALRRRPAADGLEIAQLKKQKKESQSCFQIKS